MKKLLFCVGLLGACTPYRASYRPRSAQLPEEADTPVAQVIAPVAHLDAPVPRAQAWEHQVIGLWVGEIVKGSAGRVPYSLLFSSEGDTLVAETPKPSTGAWPKGAYRRFTFKKGSPRGSMTFKAASGDGFVEGILDETERSTATELVFCSRDGGCAGMEIRFSVTDAKHLRFQTLILGKRGSDMTLELKTLPEVRR